jgi:ABC-type transport system involved in cytochrome c biogenesis ATPase subunit
VNDFENLIAKKYCEFKDNTPEGKRVVLKEYIDTIFPGIEKSEEDQEGVIAGKIKEYFDLCMLFPTTFYNATCYELSGRGYLSYLDLYDYLRDLRRRFVLFWINQVYYGDPKVMVNFVKKDENIFTSRSHIPTNHAKGVLLQYLYILLLGLVSYFVYKRSVYSVSKKEIRLLKRLKFLVKKGALAVYFIKGNILNRTLYSLLSGKSLRLKKKGLEGEALCDGKDLLVERSKKKFIYLCRISALPGSLKVKNLLTFYSRWNRQNRSDRQAILDDKILYPVLKKYIYKLTEKEAFIVLMAMLQMATGETYLINDITVGLSDDDMIKFKTRLDELKVKGGLIIYLTPSHYTNFNMNNLDICYADGSAWCYTMAEKAETKELLEKITQEEKSEP